MGHRGLIFTSHVISGLDSRRKQAKAKDVGQCALKELVLVFSVNLSCIPAKYQALRGMPGCRGRPAVIQSWRVGLRHVLQEYPDVANPGMPAGSQLLMCS